MRARLAEMVDNEERAVRDGRNKILRSRGKISLNRIDGVCLKCRVLNLFLEANFATVSRLFDLIPPSSLGGGDGHWIKCHTR